MENDKKKFDNYDFLRKPKQFEVAKRMLNNYEKSGCKECPLVKRCLKGDNVDKNCLTLIFEWVVEHVTY